MKKLTFLLVAMGLTMSVANADDIKLGTPGYGGNGCPAGSVAAILSPDRKSLVLD